MISLSRDDSRSRGVLSRNVGISRRLMLTLELGLQITLPLPRSLYQGIAFRGHSWSLHRSINLRRMNSWKELTGSTPFDPSLQSSDAAFRNVPIRGWIAWIGWVVLEIGSRSQTVFLVVQLFSALPDGGRGLSTKYHNFMSEP